MDPLIFTLSGTHCTGKTTLLHALQKDERFSEIQFIDSVTRPIKELGFPINDTEGKYQETQLLVMSKDLENLLIHAPKKPITIVDRGLFDTFIYTEYLYNLGKVDSHTYNSVKSAWRSQSSKYTLHFILSPFDIDLKDDGVRSLNPYFREQIHRGFLQEIHQYRNRKENLLHLKGSVEERVEIIFETITLNTNKWINQ